EPVTGRTGWPPQDSLSDGPAGRSRFRRVCSRLTSLWNRLSLPAGVLSWYTNASFLPSDFRKNSSQGLSRSRSWRQPGKSMRSTTARTRWSRPSPWPPSPTWAGFCSWCPGPRPGNGSAKTMPRRPRKREGKGHAEARLTVIPEYRLTHARKREGKGHAEARLLVARRGGADRRRPAADDWL